MFSRCLFASGSPRLSGMLLHDFAFVSHLFQSLDIGSVDSHVVIFPACIIAPFEWSLLEAARLRSPLQKGQGRLHDLSLHRLIPRLAARIPQGKVREQESGNTAVFDDVTPGTQDYRADSVVFKGPCDQTHGLVTHGSQRNQ